MLHQEALASLFSSINLGEPTQAGHWKLFPLFPTMAPTLSMLTVRSASERGLTRIGELPEGASVRALLLHNDAPLPVLVCEGDLFVAGRQDRIADRTMLVAAGTSIQLPVSCVERGRWCEGDRADFSVYPDSADVRLRHRRLASSRGRERPDQELTWNSVAVHRSERGLHDGAGSLVASQTVTNERAEAIVARLAPIYGATGFALCRETPEGPRVAVLAWFADPSACADVWKGGVRAAVSSLPCSGRAPKISRTELRALFAKLLTAPREITDDDEAGTVMGFTHGRTEARVLLHRGRPVQLTALHV